MRVSVYFHAHIFAPPAVMVPKAWLGQAQNPAILFCQVRVSNEKPKEANWYISMN